MASAIPLQQSSGPVVIETDAPDVVETGDEDITVKLDDGSVVVDLRPRTADKSNDKFDDNLAMEIDAGELAVLANQLLEGIDADITSRAEWEATRTRGIDLLGLKLEEPRSDVGSQGMGLEGMSTVRHPLLLEAVLRFSSNAIGELLPAEGPVKIKNVGEESGAADKQAETYQKDFNHYLTDIATEYYPDTKRMLFWVGFGGSGWKKVYSCPIRRRPVSESIDANDLIVSNAATDLWNAGRVTHRITMRPSTMKRMQYLGVYRDVALGQPTPQATRVEEKKASVEGVRANNERPEDQAYTLYECYCELDLETYAPAQFKGKSIPLPYRVTIDKDSREILEIHRNWKEDDEACLPRKYFVKYPFIEAMGIYGLGLVHILGNSSTALTAAWREMLDAGMFANFPGFAYLKQLGKQLTNEFRVSPGGGVAIDSQTGKIGDAIMPLPYKDVSAGLLGLVDKITSAVERVGGTADMPVGEGKTDAPVGTTLALIEQATKIESAVHKGLHTAQAEEFALLKERFKEDPEAFWRHDPDCKNRWNEESFTSALDNCDLVPVADPNVPSHMHRIAKGVALNEIDNSNPGIMDKREKVKRLLRIMKIDDIDVLVPPPQPQQTAPDPKLIDAHAKLISAETGKAKLGVDAQTKAAELADNAAERKSAEDLATVKLATELVIHGDARDQNQHAQSMDLHRHGLEAMNATHGATMDTHAAIREHQDAEHARGMAERQHNLAERQHELAVKVANKPKPAPKKK